MLERQYYYCARDGGVDQVITVYFLISWNLYHIDRKTIHHTTVYQKHIAMLCNKMNVCVHVLRG